MENDETETEIEADKINIHIWTHHSVWIKSVVSDVFCVCVFVSTTVFFFNGWLCTLFFARSLFTFESIVKMHYEKISSSSNNIKTMITIAANACIIINHFCKIQFWSLHTLTVHTSKKRRKSYSAAKFYSHQKKMYRMNQVYSTFIVLLFWCVHRLYFAIVANYRIRICRKIKFEFLLLFN